MSFGLARLKTFLGIISYTGTVTHSLRLLIPLALFFRSFIHGAHTDGHAEIKLNEQLITAIITLKQSN